MIRFLFLLLILAIGVLTALVLLGRLLGRVVQAARVDAALGSGARVDPADR